MDDDAFAIAQAELLKAIAASARLVTETAQSGDREGLTKAGETTLRLAGAYHSLMSAAYEIDERDDEF
jgi:hypothetical protein